MATDIFKKRRIHMVLFFAVFTGLYVFFSQQLNFNSATAFTQIPSGFAWLGANFWPNYTTTAPEFLLNIIRVLLRTVIIAVASTTTASAFALIAAVFGSNKTGIHWTIKYIVRIIAMVFRNIPLIAWALILLFSFRQNEFTGFLALFFGTFGYLTRSFTEIIDESGDGVIEALKSTGATYFQIVFQGVFPMISSQLVSWVLFMIESNIRESALVGMLTGTGIGQMFNFFFSGFRYPMAGMVLLFIIITVIGLEMLSNKIRRLLL
ncbi:MAG: ABC transporter permease subunit [Turicibacter sp.]|nr:ABC transporter permease subunit [Turicibacter sp.]